MEIPPFPSISQQKYEKTPQELPCYLRWFGSQAAVWEQITSTQHWRFSLLIIAPKPARLAFLRWILETLRCLLTFPLLRSGALRVRISPGNSMPGMKVGHPKQRNLSLSQIYTFLYPSFILSISLMARQREMRISFSVLVKTVSTNFYLLIVERKMEEPP